jgi:hypothetical protein
MTLTYAETSTKQITAENGVEYAYRDVGESAVPLVLLQHFRGNSTTGTRPSSMRSRSIGAWRRTCSAAPCSSPSLNESLVHIRWSANSWNLPGCTSQIWSRPPVVQGQP